jgi:hypothetical protein
LHSLQQHLIDIGRKLVLCQIGPRSELSDPIYSGSVESALALLCRADTVNSREQVLLKLASPARRSQRRRNLAAIESGGVQTKLATSLRHYYIFRLALHFTSKLLALRRVEY